MVLFNAMGRKEFQSTHRNLNKHQTLCVFSELYLRYFTDFFSLPYPKRREDNQPYDFNVEVILVCIT